MKKMAEASVYAFIYLEMSKSECGSMPTPRPQDTAALAILGW